MIALSGNAPKRSASLPAILLAMFGVYSVALIITEWMTSQEYVRHFVTDIVGPVPLYAINTSLSVFLLWGTALLFVVAAQIPVRSGRSAIPGWWLYSQAAVFAYLGADDRFLIHETVAALLDIGDHYVLFGVGMAEAALLAFAFREGWIKTTALLSLGVASILFAAMLGVDALAPHDLRLRLSVEDVLKTWACLMFLRFSWLMLFSIIDQLAATPEPAVSTTAAELRQNTIGRTPASIGAQS
ncbi:hypothetical protein Mal4_44830 [Maioricimonas rarisocia]|uniref:DUF998 domain-containing protein n=1 Tax=Maioricimonas rarisocia TaxID=2528026 RepID=A0A517ZCB7_9PLAN|nr:hypothetical protein [Maioricimonas rarisocia]QDU40128.1 hypothetical protein Mal4_44830 [Maioricimonas rarisocia]